MDKQSIDFNDEWPDRGLENSAHSYTEGSEVPPANSAKEESQEELWDEVEQYINVNKCEIAKWAKEQFTITRKTK